MSENTEKTTLKLGFVVGDGTSFNQMCEIEVDATFPEPPEGEKPVVKIKAASVLEILTKALGITGAQVTEISDAYEELLEEVGK